MSEEEKIERLLNSIAKGCDGSIADEVKAIIINQQKEIEEKTTIIMAGAEKVKQLEKEIEELKLDLEEMTKSYNHMKENWVHKLALNSYIRKDKIKEIFQFYIERDSLFNDNPHKMAVIRLKDVLEELLEENK